MSKLDEGFNSFEQKLRAAILKTEEKKLQHMMSDLDKELVELFENNIGKKRMSFKKKAEDRVMSIHIERELAERLAKERVKEHMSTMFKKSCAINNGKKCFKGCIHFEEAGCVEYTDWNYYSDCLRFWTVTLPYCKLWKDEDKKTHQLMEIK